MTERLKVRVAGGERLYRCAKCKGWWAKSRMCKSKDCPEGITAECKPCRNGRRSIQREQCRSCGPFMPGAGQ